MMKSNIFLKSLKSTDYFDNQLPPEDLSTPFIDEMFLPETLSLSPYIYTNNTLSVSPAEIEWKRASEIYDKVELFDGPLDLASFKQGEVGNCYFISAISSLCRQPFMIYRLFPSKTVSPAGYYEVILFIQGELKIIIVDDYFPVNKITNKLVFGQTTKSEIWFLLLEKAWAKVNGSYEQMRSGHDSFAFKALTGFTTDLLFSSEDDAFNQIKSQLNKGFIACCSSYVSREDEKEIGLFSNHSYTLVDAIEIQGKNGERRQFIQIRNPWGNSEWTGSFSNGSMEVIFNGAKVPMRTKECGWFFIPFTEFKDFFNSITICKLELNSNFKTFPSQSIKYPQVYHLKVETETVFNLECYLKSNKFSRSTKQKECFLLCREVTKDEDGVYIKEDSYLRIQNGESSQTLTAGEYIISCFGTNFPHNENPASEILFRLFAEAQFKAELIKIDTGWEITREILLNDFMFRHSSKIKDNKGIVEFFDDDYCIVGFAVFYLKNNTKNILTVKKIKSESLVLMPDRNNQSVKILPGKFYFTVAMKEFGTKTSIRKCFGEIRKTQRTCKINNQEKNNYYDKIVDDFENLEIDEEFYSNEGITEEERNNKHYEVI